MENKLPSNRALTIKTLYFYVVALVALFMIVIPVASMINLGLRTYVFTKADNQSYYYAPCPTVPESPSSSKADPSCDPILQKKMNDENRAAQRQNELVHDLSFLIVGIPLFAYHWRLIRKREM